MTTLQTTWAKTLRTLREKNESVVLSAVSNLPVTFTSDNIILNVSNPAILALLQNHIDKLPDCVILKSPTKQNVPQTLEQKLVKIFGDKLKIE